VGGAVLQAAEGCLHSSSGGGCSSGSVSVAAAEGLVIAAAVASRLQDAACCEARACLFGVGRRAAGGVAVGMCRARLLRVSVRGAAASVFS
jgi:hypothetical protein